MWLRTLKHSPRPRVTLCCFPHAGGSASAFFRFAQQFADDVEVIGVQYPGRGERLLEAPLTDLGELLRPIADALARVEARPLGFVGLSFGALVGFMTARELRRRRAHEPEFLALGGRAAPHLPADHRGLHLLPEPQFIDALVERYGDPDHLLRDPEIADMIVPALRADIRASAEWAYRDEPPLAAPLLVFAGARDRDVTDDALAAWRTLTSGDFAVQRVEGDHFVFSSGAPDLAEAIQRSFMRHLGSRRLGLRGHPAP